MITDEDIKIKYVDTLERIQGQKLKYMTKEESEYLQNRYSDSDSIKENMFRKIWSRISGPITRNIQQSKTNMFG